ncbi:hypothetical protein EV2_018837 [Malus domestica]
MVMANREKVVLLEARNLQPSVKAVFLAKLREYKSDLNKLKREIKRVASPNATQAVRDELLETGMADTHAVFSYQRERMSMSVKPQHLEENPQSPYPSNL